jgi:hypothetical protein
MTIAEYFDLKRDESGRASIDASTWIERVGPLMFRVVSSTGTTLAAPTDALASIVKLTRVSADSRADNQHVESEDGDDTDEAGDDLNSSLLSSDEVAPGVWPIADDAEPGDFEDSVDEVEGGDWEDSNDE